MTHNELLFQLLEITEEMKERQAKYVFCSYCEGYHFPSCKEKWALK